MSEARILVDDLVMGESPRWHDGRLWVCDWGAREIVTVALDGERQTYARMDSAPFSIDWLPDGTLLAISSRDAQLHAVRPGGSLDLVADLGHLSRHPWNEIVVDAHGNAYVNNIGFEFPGGAFAPGSVAAILPDGAARMLASGLAFPNGMAVTPDGRTLIVAESYGERLTAFEIRADGTLSAARTWAATPGHHPDGICLDDDGAAWYADVPNRVCVRVAPGGEQLQSEEFDRGAFACMLGGPDGRTLFVVTADYSDPRALFAGRSRTGRILMLDAPAARAGWP